MSLISALDLDFPGLEGVRAAVEENDLDAAQAAYVAYLRERDHPTWYFDYRSRLLGLLASGGSVSIANDAMRLRFTVIGIPHQFEGEIDWRFNPTTQPGSPYAANNEWTWQFNRHAYWPSMGLAYRSSRRETYAQAFVQHMLDWVEENPVPSQAQQGPGSPWRTIEAGIRMQGAWPNAFFYFLPSPSFTDEAIVTMVWSMVEHARYLHAHPTSGNWLAIEMNGLYHVGVVFPEFKEAAEWRHFAAQRLLDDMERQVYPDGVQYELTPGYHNVALSNFASIVKIARLNDYELPAGYIESLERMYEFDLYMMTPLETLPPFNDSSPGRPVDYLQTGYELFPHREDFQWAASGRGAIGKAPGATSYAFPYAGYLVQRSGWDANARYLAFDVGPLGYAHQHEDKLNFVLTAYGRHLVVDAGSYTYDNSKWRQYVLGPYGHNVAFVDGMGQNRRARPETFVSQEPAPHRWVLTPEYEFAQGYYGDEFEGFGPQAEWIATHQRSILFVKEGVGKDFWVVVDTFIPQDDREHQYKSIFHLDAPEVQVDADTCAVWTLNFGGANLGIYPLASGPDLQVDVVQGQETPSVQGWIATSDRAVRAVPTPEFRVEGPGIQHILYVFYPVPGGTVPLVQVQPWQTGLDAELGIGAEITFSDGRKYQVFVATDTDAKLSVAGEAVEEGVLLRRAN